MTKLNIVLADDHVVLSEGLKTLLDAESDMHVVGLAFNGTAAVAMTAEMKPCILVLDISMPGMNGAEVAEWVRREQPTVKIVAFSSHEDRGYVQRMLAAGVHGYVVKKCATNELIRAIRLVAAGETYIDPRVVCAVFKTCSKEVPQSGLSEREEQVVRQIALGYSNKEIAAMLQLSVKTVETYKARSLEKLGLYSRVNLVRYALQRGWLNVE